MKIIELFTCYGLDVAALAAVTCALTQILKNTLLKRAQKRLFTFLPYAIGAALYTGYAAVANACSGNAGVNFADALSHGVTTGAIATVIYAVWRQFIKGGSSSVAEGVIAAMVSGYVEEGKEGETAAEISAALGEMTDDERIEKCADIIVSRANGDISRAEIEALAKLIVETVARIRT